MRTQTIKKTGPKKRTKLAAVVKPKKKSIAKKTVKKKKLNKVATQKKKKLVVKKITKKITKPVKKEIKTVTKKKIDHPVLKKKKNAQAIAKNNPPQQKPVYVGQMEMDALWMQNKMYSAVTKKWRPPVGLSKALVCILNVLVDWQGNITQTTVEQRSGVLLYDISARTAMMQLTLPSWAYGKEFTITFKQ